MLVRKRRSGVRNLLLICIGSCAASCASIQFRNGADGVPRVLGFGKAGIVPSRSGIVHRVRAPGVSLRLLSDQPGLSIGWHETYRFYADDPAHGGSPAAYQVRSYGLDLGSIYLAVGYRRAFTVPMPANRDEVVQSVAFSAVHPEQTEVWRRELP